MVRKWPADTVSVEVLSRGPEPPTFARNFVTGVIRGRRSRDGLSGAGGPVITRRWRRHGACVSNKHAFPLQSRRLTCARKLSGRRRPLRSRGRNLSNSNIYVRATDTNDRRLDETSRRWITTAAPAYCRRAGCLVSDRPSLPGELSSRATTDVRRRSSRRDRTADKRQTTFPGVFFETTPSR